MNWYETIMAFEKHECIDIEFSIENECLQIDLEIKYWNEDRFSYKTAIDFNPYGDSQVFDESIDEFCKLAQEFVEENEELLQKLDALNKTQSAEAADLVKNMKTRYYLRYNNPVDTSNHPEWYKKFLSIKRASLYTEFGEHEGVSCIYTWANCNDVFPACAMGSTIVLTDIDSSKSMDEELSRHMDYVHWFFNKYPDAIGRLYDKVSIEVRKERLNELDERAPRHIKGNTTLEEWLTIQNIA